MDITNQLQPFTYSIIIQILIIHQNLPLTYFTNHTNNTNYTNPTHHLRPPNLENYMRWARLCIFWIWIKKLFYDPTPSLKLVL